MNSRKALWFAFLAFITAAVAVACTWDTVDVNIRQPQTSLGDGGADGSSLHLMGGDYPVPQGPATGDLCHNYPGPGVCAIAGVPLGFDASATSTLVDGGVLTLNGVGVAVWLPPSGGGAVDGGGITQLTGGVTAGPGTGSQVATLQLGSVDIAGQLPVADVVQGTADQILTTNNAASSATWATVSGDLTPTTTPGQFTLGKIDGVVLPSPSGSPGCLQYNAGAISWGSCGGGSGVTWNNDLGSSSNTHQWVSALSGSGGTGSSVTVNAGGLLWPTSPVSNPVLSQVSTSSATGQTFQILSQSSSALTGTGGDIYLQPGFGFSTNSTSGHVTFNLNAPAGSGSRVWTQFQEAGSNYLQLGPFGTGTTSVGAAYLGKSLVPSSTNYSIASEGTNLYLNGPTSSGQFSIGGTGVGAWNVNGFQFGSTSFSTGSGQGVLGITNASLNPTSFPSGGGILFEKSTIGLVHLGEFNATTTVAATGPGSGNINSQLVEYDRYARTIETNDGSAHTLSGITLLAHHGMTVNATLTTRVISASSSGFSVDQSFGNYWFCTAWYDGSTLHLTTNCAASAKTDNTCFQVIGSTSGASLVIQVQYAGVGCSGTPTLDWQADITNVYN